MFGALSLPIITDPFFYGVAIPAVLLLGISKSGFGAGFGSLAVPIMALAVSVPQAAAVLMPVLPLAPLGVWIGVRVARRIKEVLFYRVLYGGMFLTGFKLLWDGLA